MGCRVCRARKVKCDGRPNGCRNCERLQLECVDDDGSKRKSVPVSLRKIRTYRSCTSCRVSKTKCDGDRPKCSRCRGRNLECLYDGGSAPRWARNLSKAPTSASTDDDPLESPALTEATATASPSLLPSREADEDDHGGGDDEPMMPPPPSLSTPRFGRETSSLHPLSSQHGDPMNDPRLSLYSWLLSPDLPSEYNLRQVVDHYFINIHPLRCFAFVHRPSFMRHLDKGFDSDDERALLHVICAHGAKFHALNIEHEDPDAKATLIRAAGNKWAKTAEYLLLANFGKISIQRLMTCVLLYDFHFRLGEYTQALMISGLAVRMAHALQVNVEYSPDILCTEADEVGPPAVEKESRRRLMWACYILDAWTGSGVDQLTLLHEADIKIQLPSNERNFRLRIPCVTETLGVGHVLQFLPPAVVPRRPASNMGIMAYYIRIVTLWKRVVRYVKHLDSSPPPWLPESDFAALDADLRSWWRHLPEFVSYSADTIYARLESDQLASLVLIHCTYHHNLLDLYRISMPDLFKLKKPFNFPPNQHEFLQSLQADCFFHAQQIATILAEASRHGARHLADSLLPCFAFDSNRVMLYYVARLLDLKRPDAQKIITDAIHAVESNNRILRIMSSLFPLADSLCTTTESWLSKIRKSLGREDEDSDMMSDGVSESYRGSRSAALPSSVHEEDSGPMSLHRSVRQNARGSQSQDGGSSTREISLDGTSPAISRTRAVLGNRPETPVRPGLQHEQPVVTHTPLGNTPSPQVANNAVDLSDLQKYLSWDMYGIMEVNESGLKAGIEGTGMPSWTGSI